MINNIGLPGLLLLLAVSFGFLGAISSESQAEPIIDINDLTDRFSTRIVEVAVSAARSQVEIYTKRLFPIVSLVNFQLMAWFSHPDQSSTCLDAVSQLEEFDFRLAAPKTGRREYNHQRL